MKTPEFYHTPIKIKQTTFLITKALQHSNGRTKHSAYITQHTIQRTITLTKRDYRVKSGTFENPTIRTTHTYYIIRNIPHEGHKFKIHNYEII